MADAKADEAAIFNSARQIRDREARRGFLQDACNGDRILLLRIEALLQVHDESPDFLEATPYPTLAANTWTWAGVEEPGTQIGPYKLIQQIGEGGFGMVFLAQQERPLRRTVAVKILKPGMDTRNIVSRFEAEREALALMDHPNIAKVLDAGTVGVDGARMVDGGQWTVDGERKVDSGRLTVDGEKAGSSLSTIHQPPSTTTGRPYFVMELVNGVPITKYCDEHHLPLRERLALFVPLCHALQHAHQKGIIHRDIKPSNVLVASYDGKPVPKVIDFGIAKALGAQLCEHTLMTGAGALIGTLEYMSPEQAELNARDVDTRADIYSLGVLLYELLTGTTPLTRKRVKETPISEALRLIREDEPPRPSARLSECQMGKRGQREKVVDNLLPERPEGRFAKKIPDPFAPAMLSSEIRGELDWIVMKCLEKERGRRYETARALARDIECYLGGEPVEACPPSLRYRLKKFAGKHRTLLAVATLFTLVLLAATGVSLSLAVRATLAEQKTGWERDRADGEARSARRQVFAAHMNLGQSAWEQGGISRLRSLLAQHSPEIAGEDLRGFEWFYWSRLTDSALLTWKAHAALISGVAMSPDGQRLVTASHDNTVRIWEVSSGRQLLSWIAHPQPIFGVAFGPDGRQVATASADKTFKVWDAADGRLLRTYVGHTHRVVGVSFSADGRQIASASHDSTIKLWDAETGQLLRTLKGHGPVMAVAFSPDGRRLVSGSMDKTLKLWDTESGQDLRTLYGHENEVSLVAFNHDGTALASASLDRTVKIWDAASGQELRTLKGHTDRVFSVAFSPDDKEVASAGFDQTIRLWQVATGEERLALKGHTSWISSIAFSPDGRSLVSAGDDCTVRLWDTTSSVESLTIRGHLGWVLSVAFSPDGKRLATADSSGYIRIWDADSGLLTKMLKAQYTTVYRVRFSPDGKHLASTSRDKSVKLWDAGSGRELRSFTGPTGISRGVAFSPDGKKLIATSDDSSIWLWDLTGAESPRTLRGHRNEVHEAVFSPDGKQIASASYDRTIRLWDAKTGEMIQTWTAHSSAIEAIQFSPDGKYLASGSGNSDKSIKVWEVATGRECLCLEGHNRGIWSLSFSPDGKRLASCSQDKTIKIWDLASGHDTMVFNGHTAIVTDIEFSLDGARLASSSYDGTVRILDARPWTEQLRLQQEARGLIDHLYAACISKTEVIRRIEQDTNLKAPVREVALEMTKDWQEDAVWLNAKSWDMVARKDATREQYALALRQAEAAARLKPSYTYYLNTLGVALFRNGQFNQALKLLHRSDQGALADNLGRRPENVAFIAMAEFKLGQVDKARESLAQLRALMENPRWADQAGLQAFLTEATELIEGTH
jgi:WD40 repeat protein/serine/threonine protein kinase